MFMLIKNVEKPKLPKLVWALRKQVGPETLVCVSIISLPTYHSPTICAYYNCCNL